jgi:hypothetical protein
MENTIRKKQINMREREREREREKCNKTMTKKIDSSHLIIDNGKVEEGLPKP